MNRKIRIFDTTCGRDPSETILFGGRKLHIAIRLDSSE
jgi:hypothetical protein